MTTASKWLQITFQFYFVLKAMYTMTEIKNNSKTQFLCFLSFCCTCTDYVSWMDSRYFFFSFINLILSVYIFLNYGNYDNVVCFYSARIAFGHIFISSCFVVFLDTDQYNTDQQQNTKGITTLVSCIVLK